jgi:hypothetical protein
LQLIAAIVLILALGIGILAYGERQPSTTSQPSTASTASTSTSATPTTAPPVTESALDGLLLSPAEISTAMGTPGMTSLGETNNSMWDSSAGVSPPECLVVDSGLEKNVYAGSGYTAARRQSLSAPEQSSSRRYAMQALVLFPSAQAASAFFSASSSQSWPACANRGYTSVNVYAKTSPPTYWQAGPVSTSNGTLAVTVTRQDSHDGWACQRALMASNNVVIDITACSHSATDQAVNIAHQIAAKVPTT